jgi:AcrR family transcriptional regulator
MHDDDPMRERILRATFAVLSRHGYAAFKVSDVAAQAGISRPTLYKTFRSREKLIAAFRDYELNRLRRNLNRSVKGLDGHARVDAVLHFLIGIYRSNAMRGLVMVEPDLALAQMSSALPVLVNSVAHAIGDQAYDPQRVAAVLIRLLLCHFLVPAYDDSQLLDELQLVIGGECR